MINGRDLKVNGKELPLRITPSEALHDYFADLNGHRPARLYDMVLREVEEPLFSAVLITPRATRAAPPTILGINRGTLRKKLQEFGIGE